MKYCEKILLHQSIEQAEEIVIEALKTEGFGLLTRIDVQGKMKEKLGKEIEPYIILGVCNPHLAYQALTLEKEIGALLPCNVVLRGNANGTTEVLVAQPTAILQVVHNPAIEQIAQEAQEKLHNVCNTLLTK